MEKSQSPCSMHCFYFTNKNTFCGTRYLSHCHSTLRYHRLNGSSSPVLRGGICIQGSRGFSPVLVLVFPHTGSKFTIPAREAFIPCHCSAGLTHKRTKRALRAPSCKGAVAPSKSGPKFNSSKEYKFKQRNSKKCTSALRRCPKNKSGAPWAVDYIHGVDSVFRWTWTQWVNVF